VARFTTWLAALRERLSGRGREWRDTEEEIRDHLRRETESNLRAGLSAGEARRRAWLAFGALDAVHEEVREQRRWAWLEDLLSDVAYALRTLRAQPAFLLTSVAVLGLGIGVNASMFAVVDGVLLRDLPYGDAQRLVRIDLESPRYRGTLSVADVQAIAEQQRSFRWFAAARRGVMTLTGGMQPERVTAVSVTAGFFEMLEARPARGRTIEAAEDDPGAAPVVVISDGFARRRFGVAEAVGESIVLDGVAHTIVGVLPRGMVELAGIRSDVWPALRLSPPTRRGPFGLRGFALLEADVTMEQARADLAGISERIFPLWSAGYQDREAKYTPYNLRETIVGSVRPTLRLFTAATLLVLLIAVANVTSLAVVRVIGRRQELAVRAVLGAGGGRIARLLFSESLVIGLLAGVLGLGLAALGVRAYAALYPATPFIDQVALDGRTVWFAAAVALGTGFIVGLLSLLHGFSPERGQGLGSSGRRLTASRATQRFRGALVTAEFALALPLLAIAGLLLNSLLRLQRVDPGFDPEGVVTMQLSPPASRYTTPAGGRAFLDEVARRVREVPGVIAAGLTTSLPPDNFGDTNNFNLMDRPVPQGTSEPQAPWPLVTPEYFRALDEPLLEGRGFLPLDFDSTAVPVALVSLAWADRYYPGESAVGRRMVAGGCYDCPPTVVVGVVGNVKYAGLQGDGIGVYEPLFFRPGDMVNLVARVQGDPAAALSAITAVIHRLDPDLALDGVSTLEDRLYDSLARPRHWAQLLSAFSSAALVLAAVSVLGLMSYAVTQRRREIGVRLALGAKPAGVVSMLIAQGLRHAGSGIALGLVISLSAGRWLRSVLYDVAPGDVTTLALVCATLLIVALLASWSTGRRAASIRPSEAMASE
jgi:predicted permease